MHLVALYTPTHTHAHITVGAGSPMFSHARRGPQLLLGTFLLGGVAPALLSPGWLPGA